MVVVHIQAAVLITATLRLQPHVLRQLAVGLVAVNLAALIRAHRVALAVLLAHLAPALIASLAVARLASLHEAAVHVVSVLLVVANRR